MPYILKNERAGLDDIVEAAEFEDNLIHVGHLNYVLTKIIMIFINRVGLNYDNFVGIIGVLQTMQLEIYRRIGAPYENIKIIENGDVPEIASLNASLLFEQDEAMIKKGER